MAANGNPYRSIVCAPHQIAFDITNKCNLRCLHCYNSSGENVVTKNELDDCEVAEFINSVVQFRPYGFCFCGGETLLRPEVLCRGISALSKAGIACSMVTNGILLTPELLTDLVCSGLRAIQFSLDGSQPSHDKLRNRAGVYEAVTDAIDLVLSDTDLHLGVAFCPTAFNTDDLRFIYDLLIAEYAASGRSRRMSVDDSIDLRVQPLMLLGRARRHMDIRPTDQQYRKLVMVIRELQAERTRVKAQWGDPIDHLIRFMDPKMLMDQVTIHANGDIVVSPYLPLVVGNVRKHPLAEYWRGGLSTVWSSRVVGTLCSRMTSIADMELMSEEIADINMGKDIYVDLLEGGDLNDSGLLKLITFNQERQTDGMEAIAM